MASPLKTGKQSVDLGTQGVPGSRIRRDPPRQVKELVVRDRDERNRLEVIVGVLTFALAMFVIIFAFGNYSGWSPSQYTVRIEGRE
jgi:hypothetical protein